MADKKILVVNPSTGLAQPVPAADVAVVAQLDNPSGALTIGANASSTSIGSTGAALTLKGSVVNIEGPVNQVSATQLEVQDVTIATNVAAGPNAPEADFSGLVIHRGDVTGTPRHRFYIGYEANDARIDFYRDTNGDGAFAAWAGVNTGALQVNDNLYQDGTQCQLLNTGIITIRSTGGLVKIDARAGFELVDNTATILAIADDATNLEIGNGYTLQVASGGMINLPSLFKINGSAVSANVTAANLSELTGGGSTSLHSHAAGPASDTLTLSGQTISTPASGDVTYLSGNNTHGKAVNTSLASSYVAGVKSGSTLVVAGKVTVAYTGADPGNGPLYLSSTAGKVTTATAGTGEYQIKVGVCLDNTNYLSGTVVMLLQPGDVSGPY